MRVILIAETVVNFAGLEKMGYKLPPETWSDGCYDADQLAEAAGRLCYESFDRPNPATASNVGYLGNIISQQHFSVLEHSSVTFYIDGVSRSLTHELVRHRHLSYSQVSQRYVDESKSRVIIPPVINSDYLDTVVAQQMAFAHQAYTKIYDTLRGAGVDKKAARGAARSVLPNATETKIVVTGNHRAWRDMLGKRLSPGADQEIRELAQEILRQLKEVAPNTYQDIGG